MSSLDKAVKELTQVLTETRKNQTSPYDTQAEVIRVDGDTAWVHIPGGVDETPVKLTMNAQAGDMVQVRVSGGNAWLQGNATSPPTDDTTANKAVNMSSASMIAAESAVKDAIRASEAAMRAEQTAEGVEAIAIEAQTNAGIAKTSAEESLKGLSMTQDVLDVVNWVASHGVYIKATTYVEGTSYYTVVGTEVTDPTQQTDELVGRYYELENGVYVKTEDTEYDDEKTYYFVTGTPVPAPKSEDISQYYTLNVRDAMGDYIQSHLALTNEGLYVMADGSDWKVLIDDEGVYIVNPDNEKVTKYMDSIILGKDDGTQSAQILDYHSMRLFDKENMALYADPETRDSAIPYVYLSDLRDASGVASLKALFLGDGEDRSFTLSPPAMNTNYTVLLDGEPAECNKYKASIVFSEAPAAGSNITVEYTSNSYNAKAFTFGFRNPLSALGALSVAEGNNVAASGSISHAEGNNTTASGIYSHAEGRDTTASGEGSHAEGVSSTASKRYSHAEGLSAEASGESSHAEGYDTTASGNYSHAEGNHTTASKRCAHAEGNNTTASGDTSHAEGSSTTASGKYSHSQNRGTVAQRRSQTVLGEYNVLDMSGADEGQRGDFAFIIGNGSGSANLSNAFSVDWYGNARQYPRTINLGSCVCAGSLSSSAGSLVFTIPTGRVLGAGASISKLTFNIVVRASNSNGAGYYIIKATSGGSGAKAFDSTANFSFYNANNVSKTLTTSQRTISLQGSTNIQVSFSGGDDFFSGTSAIRGYINNNACVVSLTNIVVELSYS